MVLEHSRESEGAGKFRTKNTDLYTWMVYRDALYRNTNSSNSNLNVKCQVKLLWQREGERRRKRMRKETTKTKAYCKWSLTNQTSDKLKSGLPGRFFFVGFIFVSTNHVAGSGDLYARNWLLTANTA